MRESEQGHVCICGVICGETVRVGEARAKKRRDRVRVRLIGDQGGPIDQGLGRDR